MKAQIVIQTDLVHLPTDGGDCVIATLPESREEADFLLSAAQLRELADVMARRVGSVVHHAEYVVTADPAVVQACGVFPLHDGCETCEQGKRDALRVLAEQPGRQLLIGHLYWADTGARPLDSSTTGKIHDMDSTVGTETVDPLLEGILDSAKAVKSEMVRVNGLGAEIPVMLELLRGGQSLGLVFPDLNENIVSVISTFISLSDADQALFVAEGYCYMSDDGPPARRPVEGELAQWFANGDPHVHEALQAVLGDRSGRTQLASITYTYDGRKVTWGRASWMSGDEVEGVLSSVLAGGFEMQAARSDPPLSPREIGAQIGCRVTEPEAIKARRVRRNAPCLCGSGLKAKHCCARRGRHGL